MSGMKFKLKVSRCRYPIEIHDIIVSFSNGTQVANHWYRVTDIRENEYSDRLAVFGHYERSSREVVIMFMEDYEKYTQQGYINVLRSGTPEWITVNERLKGGLL